MNEGFSASGKAFLFGSPQMKCIPKLIRLQPLGLKRMSDSI
jgi:hypothetical protein